MSVLSCNMYTPLIAGIDSHYNIIYYIYHRHLSGVSCQFGVQTDYNSLSNISVWLSTYVLHNCELSDVEDILTADSHRMRWIADVMTDQTASSILMNQKRSIIIVPTTVLGLRQFDFLPTKIHGLQGKQTKRPNYNHFLWLIMALEFLWITKAKTAG